MILAYRVLLKIYAFLMTIISLLVFSIAAGWDIPQYYLSLMFVNSELRLIIGIIALTVFFVGIWTLYGSVQKGQISSTLVQNTTLGEVHITLTALENLVKRAAKQVKGIREVKTRIKSTSEGVAFYLQTSLHPGTNIPEVSNQLQEIVSGEVQKSAGIQVLEVKVLVENLTAEIKSRVE